MALGTMTRAAAESVQSDDALFFDSISFLGDGAYPTGGSPGLDTLVQALVGDSRDIIAVIPGDCGGYVPAYVPGTLDGLLKVYQGDNDNAADAPLIEVPNATDLSSVTFTLMVISK